VLELRLTLEGFDVILATDGLEGLEALTEQPDCAITDLMMPRLDGYGFCRRTRETSGFETLPIILLTAHQRDTDVDDLLELGGIIYMNKPFDAPTLTGTLRAMVAGRDESLEAKAS
jgi:DNA-binding response OmpR family regulator